MRLDIHAIDTETTGVDPETDSLLEVALYSREEWQCYEALVKFERPIPAISKAVHHIQEEEIRKLGVPRETVIVELEDHLAHSKPEERILVAHHAEFDRAFLPELKEETWICTERIAKHLLPDLESYSLQFLRYFLEVDISPRGLPHRAHYDAVCAYELFLRLYAISVDQSLDVFASPTRLAEWSWRPILVHRFRFGKYKDRLLEDVAKQDRGYLNWILREEATQPGSWDPGLIHTIHYWLDQ